MLGQTLPLHNSTSNHGVPLEWNQLLIFPMHFYASMFLGHQLHWQNAVSYLASGDHVYEFLVLFCSVPYELFWNYESVQSQNTSLIQFRVNNLKHGI